MSLAAIRSSALADLGLQRSHFEKGLTKLHGRCILQQDQIKALRAEKDKLQKDFNLQTALHALSSTPQLDPDTADLRDKCATLQQDLEKSKKFTTTQNSCIIELNAKLLAVQERLKAAEKRSTASQTEGGQPADDACLRLELAQRDSRVQELEASVARERKQIQEKDAKIQELMDRMAQTNQHEAPIFNKSHLAELQAEQEKTAAVAGRLEDALKVKRTLEQEIQALESAKEEMDDEMLGLRDQLRKVREDYGKVKEDLDWAENEKGDLEEDLLEIMRETGLSARDSFDQKKKRIAHLEQELADAREALLNYQEDQHEDANRYEKLEEKLEVAKGKLADANRDKKTAQNRVNTLSTEAKKLRNELAQLKEQNRELRNKQLSTSTTGSGEQQIQSLNRTLAKLQDDMKKLETEKKEAGKRANAASYDIVKHKEMVTRLNIRIDQMQETIDTLEWEKKDLAQRIESDSDAKIKTLTDENAALTTALETAKKKAVSLDEKIAVLEENVNSQRQYAESLERKYEKRKTAAVSKEVTGDKLRVPGPSFVSPTSSSAPESHNSPGQYSESSERGEKRKVGAISKENGDSPRAPVGRTVPPTSSPAPSTPSNRWVADDVPNEALSEEDWYEYAKSKIVPHSYSKNGICSACR